MMSTDIIEKIKKQIKTNPILLYMKGTPLSPHCCFSGKLVNILDKCKINYTYIDVLANPDIRNELPKLSNWPTFPQLWVKGKLIGGCDIVCDMYKKGELKQILTNTD